MSARTGPHDWNAAVYDQISEPQLEPKQVRRTDPHDYLRVVTLGAHLDRLPETLRDPFVDAVAGHLGDPLDVDYVRLNIDARRPE